MVHVYEVMLLGADCRVEFKKIPRMNWSTTACRGHVHLPVNLKNGRPHNCAPVPLQQLLPHGVVRARLSYIVSREAGVNQNVNDRVRQGRIIHEGADAR